MLILLLILSLIFPGLTLAQSSSDIFNHYLQSAGEYRTVYNQYTTAKNQHILYKTGATQIEAIGKTNTVLISRNKLYADYLRYIRAKLAEITNIADYAQTLVYLDLETEINQLEGMSTLGTADSIAKVNENSLAWEKRLSASERLAQATQLQIATTSFAKLQSRVESLLNEFKTKNATPSANQQITLNQIHGLLEDANVLKNSSTASIQNYKSTGFSPSTNFKSLDAAKTQLLEAAKLLNELNTRL